MEGSSPTFATSSKPHIEPALSTTLPTLFAPFDDFIRTVQIHRVAAGAQTVLVALLECEQEVRNIFLSTAPKIPRTKVVKHAATSTEARRNLTVVRPADVLVCVMIIDIGTAFSGLVDGGDRDGEGDFHLKQFSFESPLHFQAESGRVELESDVLVHDAEQE